MDEREIINSVISGNVERFGDLVSRYQERLYRFIIKINGGVAAAEDLMQETLLEAFKNLKSFQGKSKFSTWLFGIALNLCRNHQNRSSEKLFKTLSPEYIKNVPDSGDSPLKYLEKKKYFYDLAKEIDALDHSLREVLFLCSFEGLSYAEVAELIGVPEGTVKSRLFSARKALRAAMQAYEK